MHNILARLQNVFGFFTTVASCVALAIALLSLINLPSPQLNDGTLVVKNVQVVKGRPHHYSPKKEEYAHITFDLDVDLSELFTWNTKQVFLYITASYPPESPKEPATKAIIWDAILAHPLAPSHGNQYIYQDVRTAAAESKKKKRADAAAKRKAASKDKSKDKKKNSKSAAAAASSSSSDEDTIEKLQREHRPGLVQLSKQRPKYVLTDPSGRISERGNATLELAWNIQPWVGVLTWSSAPAASATTGDELQAQQPRKEWWWATWRSIRGSGSRSASFELPSAKDRAQAGSDALGTEKGGEANRGSPA